MISRTVRFSFYPSGERRDRGKRARLAAAFWAVCEGERNVPDDLERAMSASAQHTIDTTSALESWKDSMEKSGGSGFMAYPLPFGRGWGVCLFEDGVEAGGGVFCEGDDADDYDAAMDLASRYDDCL